MKKATTSKTEVVEVKEDVSGEESKGVPDHLNPDNLDKWINDDIDE